MPQTLTPPLYKDTCLTQGEYLRLFKNKPLPGLENAGSVVSYVLKQVLEKDRVSVLKKQIKNGLSVDMTFRSDYFNLVCSAVQHDAPKCLAALIKAGANLTLGRVEYELINTPLCLACGLPSTRIAQQLIEAGVPLNQVGAKSPYQAILLNNHTEARENFFSYIFKNTEGPNLAAIRQKEISNTLLYLFMVRGNTDKTGLLSLMLENFLRKPLAESKVLFEELKEQMAQIENKPYKPSVRPLSKERLEKGKDLFEQYLVSFEKKELENQIAEMPQDLRLGTIKTHKI